MPPKRKFSKEEIIIAATNIARSSGISAVTARAVALSLESSPKIIFSVFENMDDLHNEIIKKATGLYKDYIAKEIQNNLYSPYKASGMAYIRFAKEETELFKLLFMRKRTENEVNDTELLEPMIKMLSENLKISRDIALLMHLETWIFVHGIATMIATDYLQWDTENISDMLTDIFNGLKSRHNQKEKDI